MSTEHFETSKQVYRDCERAFEVALNLEAFRIHAIVADRSDDVEIVRIDKRVKNYTSIRDNYLKFSGKPNGLVEPEGFFLSATDLLGLRYVTLYNHEVDTVINALTNAIPNSDLNESLSVNDIQHSQRFGYRASHIKYRFQDETLQNLLPNIFIGVELQVRSVFSDAWALHSKKVLHKAKSAPSTALLRQFSRYSAALEELDSSLDGIDQFVDERTSFDVEVYTSQFRKLVWDLSGEQSGNGEIDLLFFELAELNGVDLETSGDTFLEEVSEKIRRAFADVRRVNFPNIGVVNSPDAIRLSLFLKYEDEFRDLVPIHKRRIFREKLLLNK